MNNYSIKDLIGTISSHSGLYGLFANPGFGTTTLSMQIARSVADMSGGTAIIFTMELPKEQWCKRIQDIGLLADRLLVVDEFCPTDQMIEDTIKNTENVRLVVIDYLELLDESISQKLRGIAKQCSIPIFVCGKLARNSGDFDPNNRPELLTIGSMFESPFGSRQLVRFKDFDFLSLLHRDHDCERGIGIAHRYNISNTTELIIKDHPRGKVGSIFIEWDEQRKCFDI
ncbi:MAG: hypothetical protein J1E96_04615 [Ruminococcus sp.]|nr:hypothetical protein [Ruminococcus sp.]